MDLVIKFQTEWLTTRCLNRGASGQSTRPLFWKHRKSKRRKAKGSSTLVGSQEKTYGSWLPPSDRVLRVDKRDVLRSIGLVPEPVGKIDSQCTEQLFSEVKRNNYFMNMLRPSEHIFHARNILHHRNLTRNRKKLEQFKKFKNLQYPQMLYLKFSILP